MPARDKSVGFFIDWNIFLAYTIVMTSSVTTYTRDQLLDLRSISAPLPRGVRKTLFSYGLWRPQRACAQHNKEPRDRSARPVRSDRLPFFDDNGNKSKLIINKNNLFINIGCLNACTINGESASLVNSIVESDLQIYAITETRHESSDDYNIKKITPDGFSCIDRPRHWEVARDRRRGAAGGGVALVFNHDIFRSKLMEIDLKPKTFEYLPVMLTSKGIRTIVVVVYRPGFVAVTDIFFDEFSRLLEMLIIHNCHIVVTGDINIHLDRHDDRLTTKFNTILECFGLVQHVKSATHNAMLSSRRRIYQHQLKRTCIPGHLRSFPHCRQVAIFQTSTDHLQRIGSSLEVS